MIMHNRHMSKIRSIHDYIGLCSPNVLQKSIAQYLLKHNFGEDYAADTRNKLKGSYDLLMPELIKLGFKSA